MHNVYIVYCTVDRLIDRSWNFIKSHVGCLLLNIHVYNNLWFQGKGLVTTYWLLGDNSPPPPKPTPAQTPPNNATSCNGTVPSASSLPLNRGSTKGGGAYRRRPSLVPSIIEEDSNSSTNDLNKPLMNNNDSKVRQQQQQKTASFRDLEMDTSRTPLLNGHGDTADIERLTKV